MHAAAGRVGALIASIPSPGSGSIHLGPIQLRAYGLMIALGVLAAGWLSGRRIAQRGWGTREQMSSIVVWSVVAGVIGARLYHVVTDWGRYKNDLGDIPKAWQGGLGIPGGLIAGIIVGIRVAKRHGISARRIATVAAPAIPLAQAIGRWGNYWNQELFGRPTTLPWSLRIDAEHLPAGFQLGTTFHPTFLYESVGNLLICGALLLIDRRARVRPGWLMAFYLMGYSALRFFTESIRIDRANEIAGLRINTWMSIVVFVGAAAWLFWDARRPVSPEVEPSPAVAPEGETAVGKSGGGPDPEPDSDGSH